MCQLLLSWLWVEEGRDLRSFPCRRALRALVLLRSALRFQIEYEHAVVPVDTYCVDADAESCAVEGAAHRAPTVTRTASDNDTDTHSAPHWSEA